MAALEAVEPLRMVAGADDDLLDPVRRQYPATRWMRVTPPTSMNALGWTAERCPIRLPRPAARITAVRSWALLLDMTHQAFLDLNRLDAGGPRPPWIPCPWVG